MKLRLELRENKSPAVIGSVKYDQVSFGLDDLKIGLCIFVASEYQNLPPQCWVQFGHL